MKLIVQLSLKISAMDQAMQIPICDMAKDEPFPQVSDSQGSKERKEDNQGALAANKEIVPEDYFQAGKGESATLGPQGIMKILVQMLTAMESRLEEVATNMMEMKEDIRAIKDDMSTMKADMSTIKEDMNTIKEDISTIKADMNTIKEDMSTIKEDILTLKQDFRMMKEDVSHLRAEANDIGQRMSKMEERSRSSEENLSTALGMIAFGQEQAAEARISTSGLSLLWRPSSDQCNKMCRPRDSFPAA